jgi:hypothetical protein
MDLIQENADEPDSIMKVHHFSLGFLGGPVDLQRMLVALAEHYKATLETPSERTRTGGRTRLESARFEFETATSSGEFHVFDDGHVVLHAERAIDGSDVDPDELSGRFWGDPSTGEMAIEFLRRAVPFEEITDLRLFSADLDDRERETGLTLYPLQDNLSVGWITVDGVLLEDPTYGIDEPGGEFLVEGQRVRFLRHRHFLVSEFSDALLSWMTAWILRSYSTTRQIISLETSQTSILRTLDSLRSRLSETNPYYWEQQRERVEGLSTDFHRFWAYYGQRVIPRLRALAERPDWPFPGDVDDRTPFQREEERTRCLADSCLTMLRQAQEILRWKGDKAIEHQMSRVNFRMILLTLLVLGITALGTFLSPALSWAHRAWILLMLVLIPPLFWGLERALDRKAGRRARLRLVEENLRHVREELRQVDREMQRIEREDAISKETRDQISRAMVDLRSTLEMERDSLQDRLES